MNLRSIWRKKISSWVRYSNSYRELKSEISELNVELVQLREALELYNDITLSAPGYLQKRVVGGVFEDFAQSGFENVREFEKVLKMIDSSLLEYQNILDFGCGCARVLLAVKKYNPNCSIVGTDIDAENIAYCQKHFKKWGTFYHNPDTPPTGLDTVSFDLIYGISVFTHLPEELQFKWLIELNRIAKPGATLLLTIENEKSHFILDDVEKKILEKKGFHYKITRATDGLPDFYQTAMHTHDYVRKEWARFFEIVEIVPLGMGNHQDFVICRKIN